MQMRSKNYVVITFGNLRQNYVTKTTLELRQEVTLDFRLETT